MSGGFQCPADVLCPVRCSVRVRCPVDVWCPVRSSVNTRCLLDVRLFNIVRFLVAICCLVSGAGRDISIICISGACLVDFLSGNNGLSGRQAFQSHIGTEFVLSVAGLRDVQSIAL